MNSRPEEIKSETEEINSNQSISINIQIASNRIMQEMQQAHKAQLQEIANSIKIKTIDFKFNVDLPIIDHKLYGMPTYRYQDASAHNEEKSQAGVLILDNWTKIYSFLDTLAIVKMIETCKKQANFTDMTEIKSRLFEDKKRKELLKLEKWDSYNPVSSALKGMTFFPTANVNVVARVLDERTPLFNDDPVRGFSMSRKGL